MGIKKTLSNVGKSIKKNSPAIFTGLGIVGLGATAYFAYKSRDRVEEIVEDIEDKREKGEEVNQMEVARDLAGAVALPVTTGLLSVGCFVMSYRIQNNRIVTLAGALAAQRAQNLYFEKKYREEHGEEAYDRFITPTDKVEVETTDKKGNKKITVQEVRKDIDRTLGQWFDQSSEYAADDHIYNMAYIDSVNERMQTKLFQRGTLLLNEVLEALGFERTRAGALLGWTTADSFTIQKVVTTLGDPEKGELKEQIWVSWTRPRYIYDDVEFEGRYSIFE